MTDKLRTWQNAIRAALAAPSAEPVASVEACMQLADAYRKTPELSATGFTNPGFKPARDRLQAAVAQLATPAQPPAPDYSEMSREALERHAARMAQALADDRPRKFWERYALGPLMAPSCLCCGKLPDKVAIQHIELPCIVICEKCRNAATLQPPAQPPAAQHTAQSRLSDELSDLYSMGFSDGSKQADDPETNEQRRAAAINLVLGRLTAAAPSVEAEPVPGRAAAGEMPPLPKKRRAMLCTKCGYSGETQAEATDRGVPCERPCGYLAIVSECDYNDEEMHAYARSCMAAAPKGPVPDAWQPIETAPKDGSDFLAVWGRQGNVVQIVRWNSLHKFWLSKGAPVNGFEANATAWHPLPAAPKQEQAL